MNNLTNTDALTEALKVIYLERSQSLPSEDTAKEMNAVLSGEQIEMDKDRYKRLMNSLTEVATAPSFGMLLKTAMQEKNLSQEELGSKALLPLEVVNELEQDSIYPNNVPVVLFKNLLDILGIKFGAVQKAIEKTFDILQRQTIVRPDHGGRFAPAFRRSLHSSRETMIRNAHQSDSNELFENKEALDKYLNRLKELMQS